MKLYQEKLNEYKRAEQELQKQIEQKKAEIEKLNKELTTLEQSLEDEKEKLSDYVQNEIVLKNYQIGKVQLEDGKIIYYPILEMPEGFKLVEEEIKYIEEYDGDYEEVFDWIEYKYTIEDELTGKKIYIEADSTPQVLGYIVKEMCFTIKASFVMDYLVKYKVKIDAKEFEIRRSFDGEIVEQLLEQMLKGKSICYNDFDEESKKKSSERLRLRYYPFSSDKYIKGWNFRICGNRLMNVNDVWKKVIKNYLEENKNTGNTEKIILDISEQIKQDISIVTKVYPLDEENTLVVILFDDKNEKICIAYEDEQLILEIPLPIKRIGIQVGIIEKPYDKEWEDSLQEYLEKENIVQEERFNIFVNELDMNKKMPILDIIGKFKN